MQEEEGAQKVGKEKIEKCDTPEEGKRRKHKNELQGGRVKN